MLLCPYYSDKDTRTVCICNIESINHIDAPEKRADLACLESLGLNKLH